MRLLLTSCPALYLYFVYTSGKPWSIDYTISSNNLTINLNLKLEIFELIATIVKHVKFFFYKSLKIL